MSANEGGREQATLPPPTFFGLVVRDMQIRLLLGDHLELTDDVVIRDARRATKQFFALYGA